MLINPQHEQLVHHLFTRACIILRHRGLSFRPMQGRAGGVKSTRNLTLGHTHLKNKTVTIDIYTPRHRKPKSYNSILRIMAHEIAHHQKPPYRQRYKGHLINRQHYPSFYQQVTKNIEKIKNDEILGQYFKKGEDFFTGLRRVKRVPQLNPRIYSGDSGEFPDSTTCPTNHSSNG